MVKEGRKKILVVRRPLKSELLIQRVASLAESTSGEAERGVERKTQRRWRFVVEARRVTEMKPRKTKRKRDRNRGNRGERRASTKGRRGERDKKRSGCQIGSPW